MNYLYCHQYESRCVSWEEDLDTIPSKSSIGCNDNDGNDQYVHLLSPCSPDESEYYLDSEEIEQCDSLDENSYVSLDDRSYVSFDERSNPVSIQSSISADSDYDKREPAFTSESKKAVLFSQQSVPVLPSPYPHLRKTSSGYIRLSSSSLHPLQLHNTAQLRSMKRNKLAKATLRRQLSPIYEKEKRKVNDQKHRRNHTLTSDTDSKQSLHDPLQHRTNSQNNEDRLCSHKKRRLNKKQKSSAGNHPPSYVTFETENIKVNEKNTNSSPSKTQESRRGPLNTNALSTKRNCQSSLRRVKTFLRV